MKYLRTVSIMMLLALTNVLYAQQSDEEANIKKTINQLFDGMRKSDSTLVGVAFNKGAILQTIGKTKDGNTLIRTTDLNEFKTIMAKPHPDIYDERIVFTKILIDDNLASVWTDYKFYIGDNHQNLTSQKNNRKDFDSSISNKNQSEIQWKFSHCGVNSFQLVKTEAGWKIVYLIDTRRKENCN